MLGQSCGIKAYPNPNTNSTTLRNNIRIRFNEKEEIMIDMPTEVDYGI